MQTVTLKMEDSLLEDIDSTLAKHRYSTRTEFIRDAIRGKLTQLEKEEAIRNLEAMRGCLKGKARSGLSEEEVGEIAFDKIAKKLGVKLD